VGLARCGTVFPVSAVVGAALPAAVCRWGAVPVLSWWGEVSHGRYTIIIDPNPMDATPDSTSHIHCMLNLSCDGVLHTDLDQRHASLLQMQNAKPPVNPNPNP